jgi:hypothetical protein
LLPVTDAVVLSKVAGGALVVVGADRIHRPQLQQSLESLETAGAHIFGIVMNKIAFREAAAYGYGYGHPPLFKNCEAPLPFGRGGVGILMTRSSPTTHAGTVTRWELVESANTVGRPAGGPLPASYPVCLDLQVCDSWRCP